MKSSFTDNRTFEKIDFRTEPLPSWSYEECRFLNCTFNGVDLSGRTFVDCSFEECDASLVKLKECSLQAVKFVNCKLLGVHFSECRPFLLELDFEGCMAKLALFAQMKLKKTHFKNCNLQEADFSEADLSGATFENCDLLQTTFFHTNLEAANFTSAFNYSINPELNRLRKAKFSLSGVAGLLDTYGIEIE
jgi:fluoroquinolone resistance protein